MPPFLPKRRLQSPSPEASSSTPQAARTIAKSHKTSSAASRKPTLFDAIDAQRSVGASDLLEKLAGASSSDELSSAPSSSEDEFEDVSSTKPRKLSDSEDEDEDEFEDVPTTRTPTAPGPAPSGDMELTLSKNTVISISNPHGTKKGPSAIERKIRMDIHKMHVMYLLWHNAVRNSWVSDKEVQKILVEQVLKNKGATEAIEKWRRRSGLVLEFKRDSRVKSQSMSTVKGKSKPKTQKDAATDIARKQRDWGVPAEVVNEGEVDMSHGDPLFALLDYLTRFWKQAFRITAPGIRKIGYMSLQRLESEVKDYKRNPDDAEMFGERVEDLNAFRQHARRLEGSRDVGAQLFTALLRGLGLDARMVASLQPVGFSFLAGAKEEAAPRKKKASKDGDKDDSSDDEASESDKTDARSKKTPSKGLSKSKGKGKQPSKKSSRASGKQDQPIDLSDSEDSAPEDNDSVVDVTPLPRRRAPSKPYDVDLKVPHYWTEVLSPVTKKYTAVDPLILRLVATSTEQLCNFEPRGVKNSKSVFAYVVGYSSDGSAKDVTVRYLKRHTMPGVTKNYRLPTEKIPVLDRKGRRTRYEAFNWFKKAMSGYVRDGKRCPRTEIDEAEEATDLKVMIPAKKDAVDGPETLTSLKGSPEFVLERFLRREEALLPSAKHVRIFTVKAKKDEPASEEKVYLRKDVVNCKTIETWHKAGRAPKEGEEPRKYVPWRAATTNRKREIAEAEARLGGEKLLQPLYSEDQTDWIIPPRIKNGVIPKNAFGNMDAYVPTMIPRGAVHLPFRSTKPICKKLGIDFAEAVTGFDFGARMAVPIITGVVVAEENAEMVMDQWRADEIERRRKEDLKRVNTAIGNWRKLMMGLRIGERIRNEYGDQADDNPDAVNPWTNRNAGTIRADEQSRDYGQDTSGQEDMAGGFLPEGYVSEEEAGGGFFPTHDEDGDHDDMIIDHDAPRPESSTAAAYGTPLSIPSTKISTDPVEGNTHLSDIKSAAKSVLRTPKRKSGTRSRVIVDSEDERADLDADAHEDEEGDVLSLPTPKRQKPMPAKPRARQKSTKAEIDDEEEEESAPTRNAAPVRRTPRRQAARKTALKSPYFEDAHSEDALGED
jgi:xeroderma pigmentosum group C-complementing protein